MLNKKLLSSSGSKYAWVTFDVSGLVGSGPTEFLVKKGATLSTVMNDFPDYDYSGNYSHLGKWYYSGSSQESGSSISLTETKITKDCVIVYGIEKYDTFPLSGSVRIVVNPGTHGYTSNSQYRGKYYYYGHTDVVKIPSDGDSVVIGSVSVSGDTSYFQAFDADKSAFEIYTELNISDASVRLEASMFLRPSNFNIYFKKKTRMYVTPELMPSIFGNEIDLSEVSNSNSSIYNKYEEFIQDGFGSSYSQYDGDIVIPYKAYPFKNGNTYTLKWEPIE